MSIRIKTELYKNILDSDVAQTIYDYCLNTFRWEHDIKTRSGATTRKGQCLFLNDDDIIKEVILLSLSLIGFKSGSLGQIYINYYRDGKDYTPLHRHNNQLQLVISLGATRTLKVGNKDYILENGDIIKFGSAAHTIPKDSNCTDGRISIALFMSKDTVISGP